MSAIRVARTNELSAPELGGLRALLDASFEDGFTNDDWEHTVGGLHVLVVDGGEVVSHAAIVERTLTAAGRPLRTGYVEGVATPPAHRRRGHAAAAMREAGRIIGSRYEMGALSTGLHELYERLGWERWRGPTYVSAPGGLRRTEEDDDGVMILRTKLTRDLDTALALVCDWRPGDVW